MLGSIAARQDARTPAERVAYKVAYVKDLETRAIAEASVESTEQHYEGARRSRPGRTAARAPQPLAKGLGLKRPRPATAAAPLPPAVPAAFYSFVMGKHKKYSSGYWPPGVDSLDASEEAALAQVCERAGITNTPGLRVLDMGCGWGSFSLYCAARFPAVSVTGVSNSNSQREYIMGQAAERGLANLRIVTSNINDFDGALGPAGERYDRVVSIEMMEHAKNYRELLARVASWLKPGGRMFVHIFTHAHTPFHYMKGDWMADHFFAGEKPRRDLGPTPPSAAPTCHSLPDSRAARHAGAFPLPRSQWSPRSLYCKPHVDNVQAAPPPLTALRCPPGARPPPAPSQAARCPATTCCCTSSATLRWWTTGSCRARTTSAPATRG